MKRKRCFAWLPLAAILAITLAGCGEKQAQDQTIEPMNKETLTVPASTQAPANAQEPSAAAANDGTQETDDGAVHVSSVKELLETIAPDTKIVVAAGRYDLTDFLQDYSNVRDQDAWNEEHPYVKLGDVFDGVEVTVRNLAGLSITGGAFDSAETEIVTDPRYAAVLNFENCSDVELACLTMGHTEMGDCSGNVLDFDDCQNIFLRTVDIYGCGVYGIQAEGCGNFVASNSTIRDCEIGPLDISRGTGDILFTACTISGSSWGGSYSPTRESKLSFVGCSFGEGESNGWYFRNDAVFENCEWSEITSYPERESMLDEYYGFYSDNMEQVTIGDDIIGRSCWVGYSEVNPQSGETEYYGLMGQDEKPSLIVTLDLNADGTGILSFGEEKENIQWEFMDGGVACRRNDGSNAYFSLYRMYAPEFGDQRDWLMMQNGGSNLIWLY